MLSRVPCLRLEQSLPSLGVSLGNEPQRGGLLRLSHVMPIRQPAQPSILLKDDRPKLVQRDSRYGFLRVKVIFLNPNLALIFKNPNYPLP